MIGGWQDIYVANDFGMYDFLYLNKGDGTFSDVSLTAIKRHDVSSMGTDIADIDNDGLLDIFNADIEMEDNYTYKTFQVSSQIEIIRTLINAGYGYQKHGNSLKLNNGNGTFSEISRTAGVGAREPRVRTRPGGGTGCRVQSATPWCRGRSGQPR